MSRALRIEFPGAFYHVTSRGNARKPIYGDDADRVSHLRRIADVAHRFHLRVHSYVLMDNHYHLLIETLEANLARAMRGLNGDYARQFNRRHRRVGHLFQGRYKAILVDRDSYLVELSRYIHLNPVRAGIVAHAEDYPWSSAPAYVGRLAAPAYLTMTDLLGRFGPEAPAAQAAYREFLRAGERPPHRGRPLDNVVAGTLLGPPAWRHAVCGAVATGQTTPQAPADPDEVPAVAKLALRPTLTDVIAAVSAATQVGRQAITDRHSRRRARSLAIYLAHDLAGLPHREIGAVFGVGRFAVSKAAALVTRQLRDDRALADLVTVLRATLLKNSRLPPR